MSELDMRVQPAAEGAFLTTSRDEQELITLIRNEQGRDEYLQIGRDELIHGCREGFQISARDWLTYKGRMCVMEMESVRIWLLDKAHRSTYTVHPGITKMYRNLRRNYWWHVMK